MSGFADLVSQASSTAGGRLADVNLDGTEGRTWSWTFDSITDAAGTPVDLTNATGTAGIITDLDAGDLLSLTFTGGVGKFTLSATSAQTAGLASGATSKRPRQCLWYCKVSSAGSVVQFWGPSSSNFRIYPE